MSEHYEVLIVGGGTAGISTAARLSQLADPPNIAIVEPSADHYYQPLWTLVGAGVFPRQESRREEQDLIPMGCTWIQDKAARFEPETNSLVTAQGQTLTYDDLIVCMGIQLNWDQVAGLKDTLGKNGVCSNYSYDTVESTWKFIRGLRSGNAVFTFPATPIKCAGAPQKIMYLAEETFRQAGLRNDVDVVYACAGPAIFGIPKYRTALQKVVDERDIETRFHMNLVEVDGAAQVAVFAGTDDGVRHEMKFGMLHVTPPQGPPDVIKGSPLAGPGGWVEVDKHTLQHVRYANVWAAGDCSSLPVSKTGAAVRKQVPVLVNNWQAKRAGRPLIGSYDGYASCPLVTGRGKAILAEFGYEGTIMETFPFDQAQERYSMYALKAYGLPQLYWHGMLRGRM